MFNGRRLILDLRSAVNISIATGMFKEAYLEELSISNFDLNGADISRFFSGADIHKLTLYNVKLINCICSGFSEISSIRNIECINVEIISPAGNLSPQDKVFIEYIKKNNRRQ